jgi:hypothetical protein
VNAIIPTLAKTCGGKRKDSYLNNKDVFLAYKAWLLQQELKTIMLNNFRIAINQEILPRLLVSCNKAISCTLTYWLLWLGFYKLEIKKGIYVNGHKQEDIIAYR